MRVHGHETDDNRCIIIKDADDTVIIGLLTDENDPNANFYTSEIERFNAFSQSQCKQDKGDDN